MTEINSIASFGRDLTHLARHRASMIPLASRFLEAFPLRLASVRARATRRSEDRRTGDRFRCLASSLLLFLLFGAENGCRDALASHFLSGGIKTDRESESYLSARRWPAHAEGHPALPFSSEGGEAEDR